MFGVYLGFGEASFGMCSGHVRNVVATIRWGTFKPILSNWQVFGERACATHRAYPTQRNGIFAAAAAVAEADLSGHSSLLLHLVQFARRHSSLMLN